MPEFMARRYVNQIDWRGVPSNVYLRYHKSASALCRSIGDCQGLVQWYGDAEFCPLGPVLLLIPGHLTLLCGMGYATAAELRDDAVNLWGKYTERLAKKGSLVDFDELREKANLPRRDQVKQLTQEAFAERIRQHKANPITDPPRQPKYPRLRERTQHTVAVLKRDGVANAT